MVGEGPRRRVPFADSAGPGADPQHAAAVLEDRSHVVAAEAVRIPLSVPVTGQLSGVAVEEVQAAVGADPQPGVAVLENRPYGVLTQAGRIAGVVGVVPEASLGAGHALEAAVGADPEVAETVLE